MKATPQVTSIYNDLLKNAKGLVFMSTWKAGIMYVGGQVRIRLNTFGDSNSCLINRKKNIW